MALRRRAWIIGSPGEVANLNFLPGVTRDLSRYSHFLQSDEGGAWKPNEVVVWQCPSAAQLQRAVARDWLVDFSIMVFTGHGYADEWGETLLAINEREAVPVSELTTHAERQLVVVDACRSFLNVRVPRRRVAVGSDFGVETSAWYRASCRALYDRAVLRTEPGTTVVFSSNLGERSIDTRGGGLFSQTLLELASNWADVQTDGQLARRVLDLPRAFGAVHNRLASGRLSQHPQVATDQERWGFPVAVA